MLRRFRVAAGFSQEYLAERAGVSITAIGALEGGRRRAPYRQTVQLLAQALELSDDDRGELEQAAARGQARRLDKENAPARVLSNVSVPETSFIGRQEDVAAISALLDANRFVTISGSGGIGKTRVALQVGDKIVRAGLEEVWFVDFAPLTDGSYVPGKIAEAVYPRLAFESNSISGLAAALRGRRCVLIFDNCEHLIDSVAHIVTFILRMSPATRILATSRERLGVAGESLYRLKALAFPKVAPTDIQAARSYAAIDLLLSRAQSSDPQLTFAPDDIPLVVEICARLDGLPLAIELVAARVATFGLSTLRARLGERFALTVGGARDKPARHQTMLATIAWSDALLTDPERILLRRLAIFSGSFSLEGVERVCSGDGLPHEALHQNLSSLVDKSLVNVAHERHVTRYSLLESVRSFGLMRLNELAEHLLMSRRHAAWLADVADEVNANIMREPMHAVFDKMWPDFDNIRAALEWSLHSPVGDDNVMGGRIVGGLRALWVQASRMGECQRWVDRALEKIDESAHPEVVGRLLRTALQWSHLPNLHLLVARTLGIYERLDNRRALATVCSLIAFRYCQSGDLAAAERLAQRSADLMASENLERSLAYASFLTVRALISARRGSCESARRDVRGAEALAKQYGDDYFGGIWCRLILADVEFADSKIGTALAIVEDVLHSKSAAIAEGSAALQVLATVAALRLATGDEAGAQAAARGALSRGGGQEILALGTLAAAIAIQRDARLGTRLMGFLEMWRSNNGDYFTPIEQSNYDILLATVTGQLSAQEVADLAAEGRNLTLERAKQEALAATE